MNKDEAIALLAACVPLASKLLEQGINIKLSEVDRKALTGFNKVRLAGWLDSEYFHRQAGLLRSQVIALTAISIKESEGEVGR